MEIGTRFPAGENDLAKNNKDNFKIIFSPLPRITKDEKPTEARRERVTAEVTVIFTDWL